MDDRASIFSSKFRTPRLPALEEVKVLQVWELIFQLMDLEAELSAKYGSDNLLYDLVSQKTIEKEAANPNFINSLRKELGLGIESSQSKQANHKPRLTRSKNSLRSKSSSQLNSETSIGQQEEFRKSVWTFTKDEHPDDVLVRWLTTEAWDVANAFRRILAALRWRSRESDLEGIARHGEEGALNTIKNSKDERERKIAEGFMLQLKLGMSFVHGIDWEGRPIITLRMRLHHASAQPVESMRRFVLWHIECTRLMLGPSIQNVVLLYDFSGSKAENVEMGTSRFMVDKFTKYFAGATGLLIFHQPPKFFEPFWNIIKGWLNPESVAKVRFTRTVKELEQYIPRSNILKSLGGDDEWVYEYVPVREGENDQMKDLDLKEVLLKERNVLWTKFEDLTREMIQQALKGAEYASIKKQRNEYADYLRASFWRLDPFTRARSYYDRIGAIGFRRESAFLAEKSRHGDERRLSDLFHLSPRCASIIGSSKDAQSFASDVGVDQTYYNSINDWEDDERKTRGYEDSPEPQMEWPPLGLAMDADSIPPADIAPSK